MLVVTLVVQVLLGGKAVGGFDRNKPSNLTLPASSKTDESVLLEILVEAIGRDNGGAQFDVKGLTSQDVKLNGEAPCSPVDFHDVAYWIMSCSCLPVMLCRCTSLITEGPGSIVSCRETDRSVSFTQLE